MPDLHRIVVVHGACGVEKGREKVSLCVTNEGGVVIKAVQNVQDVVPGDPSEPALDIGSRIGLLPDADLIVQCEHDLQDVLDQLVDLLAIGRCADVVVVDLLPQPLPLSLDLVCVQVFPFLPF